MTLPLESEKILASAIQPHLLSYCARTDLFAVVTQEEVVDVYRFSGQRAFTVKRKDAATSVVGLQWIRDGRCLAVAMSDGNVDIVSGESGKILRYGGDDPFDANVSASQQERGAITCLGWGTVATQRSSADFGEAEKTPKEPAPSGPAPEEVTTEEWYDGPENRSGSDTPGLDATSSEVRKQMVSIRNLPQQLAIIDVESALPRLSPIPSLTGSGVQYDMFSTQAALDDYFNSMQRKDRLAADMLIVGHSDGRTRVIIDDILEIEHRAHEFPGEMIQSRTPLLYASHSQSGHHALLCATPAYETVEGEETIPDVQNGNARYSRLSVNIFDIPLMTSGGSHLHSIVSGTAKVRDLSAYISYSIICAKCTWTKHTTLPSRFMENINETLAEKKEGSLDGNLYHLAMTGNFTPTILEWLKDELAERGHKRWHLAMTSFYDEASKVLQTNLLPALERCSVVATNLRGLARFYEGSNKFDVSPSVFTNILEALGCLQLLAHEATLILGQEKRQFEEFAKWLRHQVDLAAADPESVSAREMAEREAPKMDYDKILPYIAGALTKTRMEAIVHASANGAENKHVTSDDVIKAIHAARHDLENKSELLSLHVLSANVNKVCKAAQAQILRWQTSAGPTAQDFELETGPMSSAFDMRTIRVTPSVFKTVVLSVPLKERNKISVHSITQDRSPRDTRLKKDWRIISMPENSAVESVKFLDDSTFLALITQGNTTHLVRIPFDASTTGLVDQTLDCRTQNVLQEFVIHTFAVRDPFVPAEMVVNNRKGRRNVLVVAKNYRQWKIFSLEPAGARDAGGEKDEDEDEEEE